MPAAKVAIIGERDPEKKAHQGVEASFALHNRRNAEPVAYEWIATSALTPATIEKLADGFSGFWCAPGSPYASAAEALLTIRHARENGRAFLGTCGGFQHALMEFAQNVLHLSAAHQELTPDAPAPLIVKLSCSLADARGKVVATNAERFRDILGADESIEEFNCNYGVNENLANVFHGSDVEFVAHDEAGQIRAFRLKGHAFFVGTLFQPERKAQTGTLHPVVRAFFDAASDAD